MRVCAVEVLETQAVLQSASQIEALVGVFLHATRVGGLYLFPPFFPFFPLCYD